jgi:hypothetical protein
MTFVPSPPFQSATSGTFYQSYLFWEGCGGAKAYAKVMQGLVVPHRFQCANHSDLEVARVGLDLEHEMRTW